jgi:hypothetical protein
MIESVRTALRKMGGRAEALGACPVCGRQVSGGDQRVRAWQGKYAHSRCAGYRRDRGHSHRIHGTFTTP